MHVIQHKTQDELNREWDAIAALRFDQITSQRDITYHRVLTPSVFSLLDAASSSSIVDLGCGIGHLSHELARKFDHVTAVDPSHTSIQIARQNFSRPNLQFVTATAEEFALRKSASESFDVAVANMVLMDVLDLQSFIKSVAAVLRRHGIFLFTITHPWFFPHYWKYNNEPWFIYNREIMIEENFRISNELTSRHITTHIHRPWQQYFLTLRTCGFDLRSFVELYPDHQLMREYPSKWIGPHYISAKCSKAS